MFDQLTKYADLPGRLAMALIFLVSGIGKIGTFAATQGYMEAFGLPGFLLVPTIAFEIGAGLALAMGIGTRAAALLMAGFSLLTAFVFHRNFADQTQQIMFLKNIAMAGGFLLTAKYGASGLSVDVFLRRKRKAAQ